MQRGSNAQREALKEYNLHLASLRSCPVHQPCEWEDKKEVIEGRDFELCNTYIGDDKTAVYAYPVPAQQESEDTAKWADEDMLCIMAYYETYVTGATLKGILSNYKKHCEKFGKPISHEWAVKRL